MSYVRVARRNFYTSKLVSDMNLPCTYIKLKLYNDTDSISLDLECFSE